MATFYFDGDELKECPYNPLHRVLSGRLLSHMTKCAAEPNAPKLKECPFNSLHRVYPSEFEAHVVECPDNRQAIREMLAPQPGPVCEPSNDTQSQDIVDEWEADARSKDYVLPGLEDNNDEVICDGGRFISQQSLYGLKPSERKRIYAQRTENVIARQAQQERENLTEEEARDLGIDIKPRAEFTIDPKGEPSESREESNVSDREEEPSESKRPRRSDDGANDPFRTRVTVKRPPDDSEDNKERVKKAIRRNESDCFLSRKDR